jgi:hypothetical protein
MVDDAKLGMAKGTKEIASALHEDVDIKVDGQSHILIKLK